jgi:hypothetical protein
VGGGHFVKLRGVLIIALFLFQGVVLNAVSACRFAPPEVAAIGLNGERQCSRVSRADHLPHERRIPADFCCLSCTSGGADADSSASGQVAATLVEWPTRPAFSIVATLWTDTAARRVGGWSTTWSSRAPPIFS